MPEEAAAVLLLCLFYAIFSSHTRPETLEKTKQEFASHRKGTFKC